MGGRNGADRSDTGEEGAVAKREDIQALAQELMRETGVDFETFNPKAVADDVLKITDPFRIALPLLFGLVAGLAMGITGAFIFAGDIASEPLRALAYVAYAVFGMVAGMLAGVFLLAGSLLRNVEHLASSVVRATLDVVGEISGRADHARELGFAELMRGSTWLVFVPLVERVMDRRFKLKLLTTPAKGAFRLLLGRIVPLKAKVSEDDRVSLASVDGAIPEIAGPGMLTKDGSSLGVAEGSLASRAGQFAKSVADGDVPDPAEFEFKVTEAEKRSADERILAVRSNEKFAPLVRRLDTFESAAKKTTGRLRVFVQLPVAIAFAIIATSLFAIALGLRALV